MEKKSVFWWVAFIFMFIWQLPQALVALVMMPFLGKLTLIYTHKFTFCFMATNMSGGISLGPFAFVSEYSATKAEIVAHETKGHPWDSYIMGWLYLFIIGIPSILNAAFDFTKCYYDFYTEKWANKHAKLYVVGNCRTAFIDMKDKEEIKKQDPYVK